MINIYWSPHLENNQSTAGQVLLSIEPEPLLKSFIKKHKSIEGFANYIKCPSVKEWMQNTYVVFADRDMTVKVDKQHLSVTGTDEEEVKDILPTNGHGVVQFNFSHYFIADKSVNATLLPPFMEENYKSNTLCFYGGFDIGRWARPFLQGAFFKSDESRIVSIKRGDPLFYIRFETNEKINFKPFFMTHNVLTLTTNGAISKRSMKFGGPPRPLEWFYNLTRGKSIHKKLINEIEKSLL